MLILVTGGSASGKSAFAEQLAADIKMQHAPNAALVYIATMEPYSEAAKEKITHHHELRAGKGFVTLEHYADIGSVIPKLADSKPVVLLECLSNLLANEMFAPHVTEDMRREMNFEKDMCGKICDGLRDLERASSCLIVVSCIVSADGASYAWETVKYIRILEQIQKTLAAGAEQAYEVVCGIPVTLKREIA